MKKVAINILRSAKIYAPKKIEELDEKRIIPNMMLRRRLTRNAKIMLFLSDKCGFSGGKIIYSSCFGELQATAEITTAILSKAPLSPTSFQNSVYNTAPSYFSLLNEDKDEIFTISSGAKSSLDGLKTAALQALISKESVLCVATECLDIANIDAVNSCCTYLESGAAVVLEIAEETSGAQEIEGLGDEGVIASLEDLIKVVNMHNRGISKILITL